MTRSPGIKPSYSSWQTSINPCIQSQGVCMRSQSVPQQLQVVTPVSYDRFIDINRCDTQILHIVRNNITRSDTNGNHQHPGPLDRSRGEPPHGSEVPPVGHPGLGPARKGRPLADREEGPPEPQEEVRDLPGRAHPTGRGCPRRGADRGHRRPGRVIPAATGPCLTVLLTGGRQGTVVCIWTCI